MTKTLTEQWREGTLEKGFYYIKTRWFGCDNKWHYNKEQDIDYLDSDGEWCGVANDSVVEIIGPVPSYDEYKRLQEQLADASKTIDYYDKKDFHYTLADGTVMGAEPAHKYKIKWGVK